MLKFKETGLSHGLGVANEMTVWQEIFALGLKRLLKDDPTSPHADPLQEWADDREHRSLLIVTAAELADEAVEQMRKRL